jgi:hypothetical protein
MYTIGKYMQRKDEEPDPHHPSATSWPTGESNCTVRYRILYNIHYTINPLLCATWEKSEDALNPARSITEFKNNYD